MAEYLVIFDDQFNAFEFIDDVDVNDLQDTFQLDKYSIYINENDLYIHEPYTLVPTVVVIDSPIHKYEDLCNIYEGRIVRDFTIK